MVKELNDLIKGFKEGFIGFSHNIGNFVNFIILSFVYIIGVGLTSIAGKIVGKEFLDLKLKKKGSYWKDLNLKTKNIEEYYRQF